MRNRVLTACGRQLTLDRMRIMGILNVTPDSFYDGGRHASLAAAIDRAAELVDAGSDIIDVGGESTRPGATPVSQEEEAARALPVIEALAKRFDVLISADTYRFETARDAIAAGAVMINDVTAARYDQRMPGLCAETGAALVLMHALWPPKTMQADPKYVDVLEDVASFLVFQAGLAVALGIPRESLVIDPGIGFGKTLEHNLQLLKGATYVLSKGFAVMYGPSRKRFIGELCGRPDPGERLFGTAGACAVLAAQGVHVIRVHDVREIRDAVKVADAIAWGV